VQPDKVYKGYFFNDKKHGYGMYVYQNNTYLIGRWVEDIMDGLAICLGANKNEELVVFRKHREKKMITDKEQVEEIKKSEEYQRLLVFLEELENKMIDDNKII
jgi:hypothetical protein